MSGKLVVISGPSGVGKDTIANRIRESDPNVAIIVSYTTRPMRGEEKEGVDYHFVSLSEFLELARRGAFLEFQDVNRSFYATPLKAVESELAQGKTVILVIDVMGMLMARSKQPDLKSIFVRAPSHEELETRLRRRELASFESKKEKPFAEASDDETAEFEANVLGRLLRAVAEEALSGHYDHIVTNDDLDKAVTEVREWIG